uniref:Uncharacterized protein n=1 Tax=Panagrolaimus sp. ES5 TaxID=591445 RepID=A0AC34FU87_9BILA
MPNVLAKIIKRNGKDVVQLSEVQHVSRFRLSAVIQNEGKENEFVYLSNQKHICQPLEFSNFIQESPRQIVMALHFQLIKRKIMEKIVQHMVLFTKDEKSECYEYTWSKKDKRFICWPCKDKHKIHVSAKLIKNDKYEECIELCPTEHKYTPIGFIHEDITVKIVTEPGFKLWEQISRKKTLQKLTIYDSNDKNHGYIYSYKLDKKNYFYCI